MPKVAFAPIIDSNSRILLLGTMPSEESLRKQEYYGHKSNQFWKIIFSIYNKPFSLDYRERVALLHEKGIALWDVLQSCEGKGSADSNIVNGKPNDFTFLFNHYPQIRHVFFTSRNAEIFYKKYISTDILIGYSTLPSPSSAYASMRLEEKTQKWRVALSSYLDLNV